MHQYRFFYPIDDNEEWVRGHELPHDSICFRKPHLPEPRVSVEMVAQAKSTISRHEHEGAAEGERPRVVVSAAEMRMRADWR